jgi:hypothetical protein
LLTDWPVKNQCSVAENFSSAVENCFASKSGTDCAPGRAT